MHISNILFVHDIIRKEIIAYLYYAERVTENKIHRILEEIGIIVSEGDISNILTKRRSRYSKAHPDEKRTESKSRFEGCERCRAR
jgi:hypothetical protein